MAKDEAIHLAVNVRTLGHFTTGVQRYLAALLPHLGEDVRRIAPGQPLQGIRGHVWEQFVLPGRVGADLLWSPGNTGPLGVAKQVLTLHDASTLDHPEWFEAKFARWYGWMLPRLARKVSRIITVSAHARERILERLGLGPERVVAIHNGVDASFAPAAETAMAELRARLDLPARFFLYVGSLEPRKNLRTLVKAWNLLPAHDFHLVVAGTSGHVFRETGLEPAPNVRFLGRVAEADLPVLYSAAHAFVFPSTYEGFGLPPLEAMACGCPVLSSSTTSLPEVCGPAFVTTHTSAGAALYFDPADPESIAHSLTAMIACAPEDRRLMCANAVRRAARFSWESAARNTRAVLEQARGEAG